MPPLTSNLQWQSFIRDTTFYLAEAPQLAGDYNANGTVDAADYVVVRSMMGQSGIRLAADGTGPAGARMEWSTS